MNAKELKAKVVDFLFTVAYIEERRDGFTCQVMTKEGFFKLQVFPDTQHGRLVWSSQAGYVTPQAKTLADLGWREWGQLLAHAENEYDQVFEPS